MPQYKQPKNSFVRALEREMNDMAIDFALYLNGPERAAAILDDMMYTTSFWECQSQEVVDALQGLQHALCGQQCPDCGFMMSGQEVTENRRRCGTCEAMPYEEWCAFTNRPLPGKDDE